MAPMSTIQQLKNIKCAKENRENGKGGEGALYVKNTYSHIEMQEDGLGCLIESIRFKIKGAKIKGMW